MMTKVCRLPLLWESFDLVPSTVASRSYISNVTNSKFGLDNGDETSQRSDSTKTIFDFLQTYLCVFVFIQYPKSSMSVDVFVCLYVCVYVIERCMGWMIFSLTRPESCR